MRIQEAFFLWLEALGQLYMEGTTVPEVIADTSHRVGCHCRQLLAKQGAKEWSPTTTWFAVRRSNKTALPVTIGPSVSKIFSAQFSLYFYVNKENPTEKLRLVKYSCDFPSKPGWI